jgi:nicotinamidase-related amidase
MLPTLENSLLVAVDVQVGFVTHESAHAVPVIADLVSRWQRAGGATVFTQFINAPDSPYVRLIGWEAMMPGTPGVEFAPEIRPYLDAATIVTPKGTYSSLTAPVLEFILQTGRNNVWISGLDTESCVLATAVAAFDANLDPWVITDACASHAGQVVHEAGLLVAARNLGPGHLVTTADIPTEVLAGA